jgi:hypothetical protein
VQPYLFLRTSLLASLALIRLALASLRAILRSDDPRGELEGPVRVSLREMLHHTVNSRDAEVNVVHGVVGVGFWL